MYKSLKEAVGPDPKVRTKTFLYITLANQHSQLVKLPSSSFHRIHRSFDDNTIEAKRPVTPLIPAFPNPIKTLTTAGEDRTDDTLHKIHAADPSLSLLERLLESVPNDETHETPVSDSPHSNVSLKRTRGEEDNGYSSDQSSSSEPKRHRSVSPSICVNGSEKNDIDTPGSAAASKEKGSASIAGGDRSAIGVELSIAEASEEPIKIAIGFEVMDANKVTVGLEEVADINESSKEAEKLELVGEKGAGTEVEVEEMKYGFA